MTSHITDIIKAYQSRVARMPHVQGLGQGASFIREDGVATTAFLLYLFSSKTDALQFLKDLGLIASNMQCPSCHAEMRFCCRPHTTDGYRWACRKVVDGRRCNAYRSIRYSSWFSESHLTFLQVMLLTYHIVRRLPARNIRMELHLAEHTVTDWTMFCREAMMDYVARSSEKLGGPGKIVEIDESCFGRRKYNRGTLRNTTWVFGGVERQSGRTFLVPVPDRSADTLTNIIHTWIEPQTTVISDCWAGYRLLSDEGYTHHTVNHTVDFVDPHTGAHTNTIEGTC